MTPEKLIERAKTYVVVGPDGAEVNLGEEIECLRAALQQIVDLGGAYGSRAWMHEADRIARAALESGEPNDG